MGMHKKNAKRGNVQAGVPKGPIPFIMMHILIIGIVQYGMGINAKQGIWGITKELIPKAAVIGIL